jgi:uncharacterized phage protein gp47/JayE
MASIPSQRNPLTILRGFRNELQTRTNITNFDRDSKARAISDVFTEEILNSRQEMANVFKSNQLSSARGADLDRLGASLGKTRRDSSFANVTAEELSLAMYVDAGTFGTINGGFDIIIPAGTLVFSKPNNNELGATVNYSTTASTTLFAGSSLGYLNARAQTIGSSNNVGSSVLINHQFVNYVDSVSGSLKVINFFPILNGRNRESDDQYRFRISQLYNRLMQNNDTRIRLDSLAIPGVLNVKTVSGFYGIGTAAAIVTGAEGQSNDRLIQGVQGRLLRAAGPGLTTQAVPATQVFFDIEMDVRTTGSLTLSRQEALRGQIRRTCINYFRGASSGRSVFLSELARQIQKESGATISLGSPGNETKLFKRAYIRKGLAGGSTSERQRLISGTIILEVEEFADLGTLGITFI